MAPLRSRNHQSHHGGRAGHARRSAKRPVPDRREALERGAEPLNEAEWKYQQKHQRRVLEQLSEQQGKDLVRRYFQHREELPPSEGLFTTGLEDIPSMDLDALPDVSDVEWEDSQDGTSFLSTTSRTSRTPRTSYSCLDSSFEHIDAQPEVKDGNKSPVFESFTEVILDDEYDFEMSSPIGKPMSSPTGKSEHIDAQLEVKDKDRSPVFESFTEVILDDEFDFEMSSPIGKLMSTMSKVPETGKPEINEKSKEVSGEKAGLPGSTKAATDKLSSGPATLQKPKSPLRKPINTLQKPESTPQEPNNTSTLSFLDAFQYDPVLLFAKNRFPTFHDQVIQGNVMACQMQELLLLFEQVAQQDGLLYPSEGYPMELTAEYTISADCRIPFTGLCQLWPNIPNDGSWFGSAILDPLVRLSIMGVQHPGRAFLSTDDLVPWLTCGSKETVEKKLKDVLKDPVISVRPDGRTTFSYTDTQSKPSRTRELSLPAIPDDVDTVIFPYIPSGDHWVAVEIVANTPTRTTRSSTRTTRSSARASTQAIISIFNSIPERHIEEHYAEKELGLLTRLIGRVQANGKFTNIDRFDVKEMPCPRQFNSEDCGPLTVHAISERLKGNELPQSMNGRDLRGCYIQQIYDASFPDRSVLNTATSSSDYKVIKTDKSSLPSQQEVGQSSGHAGAQADVTMPGKLLSNAAAKPTLEDRPYRTWICDIIEQSPDLTATGEQIFEGIEQRHPGFLADQQQARYVRCILENTSNLFQRSQPSKDVWTFTEQSVHCVSTAAVNRLHNLPGGLQTADDIDIDFRLVISCIRQSSFTNKVEVQERKAEELFRSWWGIHGQQQNMPEEIKSLQDLRPGCQWMKYLMAKTSRVPFLGVGQAGQGRVTAVTTVLFSLDTLAKLNGERFHVLILQVGIDGTSTNTSTWDTIQKLWPNLDFHMTIARTNLPVPMDQAFVKTDNVSWGYYNVSTLAETHSKTRNEPRDPLHEQILTMMSLVDNLKLDKTLFPAADTFVINRLGSALAGRGLRVTSKMFDQSQTRKCQNCRSSETSQRWWRGRDKRSALLCDRCASLSHLIETKTNSTMEPASASKPTRITTKGLKICNCSNVKPREYVKGECPKCHGMRVCSACNKLYAYGTKGMCKPCYEHSRVRSLKYTAKRTGKKCSGCGTDLIVGYNCRGMCRRCYRLSGYSKNLEKATRTGSERDRKKARKMKETVKRSTEEIAKRVKEAEEEAEEKAKEKAKEEAKG